MRSHGYSDSRDITGPHTHRTASNRSPQRHFYDRRHHAPSQLVFEPWYHGDAYADWHTKTALEPMLRALFLRELLACRDPDSSYTKTDHERRLREPGVAEQFGFDLDEDEQAPCRTTYDRTWKDRLSDDLRHYIAHTAERVCDYAHENGIHSG